MTRRRIQPKAAVELETVSLRLPAELVRAVEQYAAAVPTQLQNNVTAGRARSVPPAPFRNTAVFAPALSASLGGPFTFPRQ